MLKDAEVTTRDRLLAEVHIFVSETGRSEEWLSRRAMKDSRALARIRGGGGLTIDNLDNLRRVMAEERARRAGEAAEAAARLGGNGAGHAQGDEP